MTFPRQTRLKKMRLLVVCIRGAWALQSDSADATVKYNQASDEQDQPQGERCVQDCILIQPGPEWTHPDRPGGLEGSLQQWAGIGELCITATKAHKTRLLRATGLAGFVFADVPGWKLHVNRDSGQLVLSTRSSEIPLVQLRAKFVLQSFEALK